MKRFLSGALALLTLLLFCAGCARQEEDTATTPATAAATAEDGLEEAIAAYLTQLRSGAYDEDKLFVYDDLSEYFLLGQYQGLTYPEDDYLNTEVTDQEVEDYLTVAVMNNLVTDEQYTRLTEGEIQRYDVAHLVYEGSIEGVAQEKTSTGPDGADLIIGSGSYLPGFEEGLIGSAVGSTVTLDLAFSPYYGNEEMAGKSARFVVTVEYVQRPQIPEITAEMVNQIYSTTFADMDAVRASLKEELGRDHADRAQSSLNLYLQAKIMADSRVIAYPEKEMAYYRSYFESYIQQYADSQQKSLEDYLTAQGFSMEEFEEKKEAFARSSCETDMMIFSIVNKEKIEATDEQIAALIRGLYENKQDDVSPKDMIDGYVSSYGPFYFENRVTSSAAMELIRKAAVPEKP